MNSFFRDVISHLIKNAFEGHTQFSVADNTAVGANPVRSITLDAVPSNENTIISLSWEGGEKLFEKTLSEQEASHQFDLISTDLAEVAALTKQGNYEGAKDLMKKLGQKYAENTGDIVDTNLPKLHNTQAAQKCERCEDIRSEEDPSHEYDPDCAGSLCAKHEEEWNKKKSSQDDKLWRTAKITMQNLWFSTTDELLEYQEKQKGAKSTQDHIPLWDAQKGKDAAPKDGLAPASLSYEDVENEKERDHEDMQKHIDEKIKTELESALQEKAASVFGPADIELVKSLRAPGIGRNWDEIKKIFIKDLNRDKDATTIFLDEQRESLDPTGIEVEPVKEEPAGKPGEEKAPLTPPEELVSPETHEKLLQDHEDKKKAPLTEDKELNFTPKDVMDIPEDEEIEQQSSLNNEIARADNDEIHKVATKPQILRRVRDQMVLDRFHIIDDKTGIGVGIPSGSGEQTAESLIANGWVPVDEHDYKLWRKASLKTAGPSDLNPLQEPIQEKPTTPTTPSQDVVPMGKKPTDHNAPQHGDRVFVTTDLSNEKSGFEANFINTFKGDRGEDKALVVTDQGDNLEVELNRVVKINEGSSGAQDTEPTMEPLIEQQQPSNEVPVTPKMDDFHTSEQDPFLAIQKEAEALLKTAEIWNLESPDEEFAAHDLSNLANQALEGDTSLQEYLQTLWGGESWESIQKRLQAEGSTWYVWWMDGVHAYMRDQAEVNKESHKISYMFVKKGLEKHAGDSAFEANGWTRVWVDESEIEVEPEYAEILKMPDEAARIQALKELARKVAQDTLRTKANAGGDIAQMWFDSLKPSDHDRIDWVKLANPQQEEVESSLKQSADGSACIKCHKVFPLDQMISNEHGAGYLCKEHASEWNKDASLKEADVTLQRPCEACGAKGAKDYIGTSDEMSHSLCGKCRPKFDMKTEASDFEKGISQNKTSAEPVEAPKTQFKDYKITPKYTPKEQAIPATPEMGEMLSKIEAFQADLDVLETARKQLKAKLNEEIAKIDQQGGRAEIEAALQETIEQTAILFNALDNKVVQWKDNLYTLQTEQVDLVPQVTDKEKLQKIYKKFADAEQYIKDVMNGILSQAKRIVEKTLIRWPNKKSSIAAESDAQAESNIIDDLKHYNDELLAALKILSSPL